MSHESSLTAKNELVEVAPLNVQQLNELGDFLETLPKEKSGFSINILPNVIKNLAEFLQENKKMKIQNRQFEKKCKITEDALEKNFDYAIYKVQRDAEARLSEIDSFTETKLAEIQNDTLKKLYELQEEYKYKNSKLDREYDLIEMQIKQNERLFDKRMKVVKEQIQQRDELIRELGIICKYLQKKIISNKATKNERETYFISLNLRNTYITQNADELSGVIITTSISEPHNYHL